MFKSFHLDLLTTIKSQIMHQKEKRKEKNNAVSRSVPSILPSIDTLSSKHIIDLQR